MKLFFRGEVDVYGAQDLLRLFFSTPQLLRREAEIIGLEVPDGVADVLWLDTRWTPRIYLEGHEDHPLASYEETETLLSDLLPSEERERFYRKKRDHKRLLYLALLRYSGKTFPWGSLTGIRPTIVAAECLDLVDEEIARRLLEEYFFLSSDKTRLAMETAKEEKRLLATLPEQTMAAYFSIPFCPSRCSYCSFSTPEGIGRSEENVEIYLDAVEGELRLSQPVVSQPISTLYVGGGTPGSLSAKQTLRLGQLIRSYLPVLPGCEMTFEAGRPDALSEEKLLAIREAGFTKICINPQTFHNKTLQIINRQHEVEDFLRQYELARTLGFENINIDLILGLPGEEPEEMRESLRQVEHLAPDSFTLHSLALKRSSKMKQDALEGHETSAVHVRQPHLERLQKEGEEMAKRLGLVPYYLYRQKDGVGALENLGYARPGRGNRYNLAMMGDGLPVLSFGAGAMSKWVEGDRVERVPNVRSIAAYCSRYGEMAQRKLAVFPS